MESIHDDIEAHDSDQGGESSTPPVPLPADRKPLDWMDATLQWGTKAEVGPHGLTLEALNVGIYGVIPEESLEMTRLPRGAYPVEGVPRVDVFSVNRRSELWADNAAALYEEAIQRRWIGRTDIPWDTLAPLPDDVELAMCQLCTELSQQASIEAEVLGQWLHRMNYAYHEVKSFLATEAYDSARHFEVFRLRALARNGALGLESPGYINRRLLESRAGWPETALYLYLMRGTLTQLIYRYGEAYAHDPAEKLLFRLCIQDKARHMAYGTAFLKQSIREKGSSFALSLLRLMSGVERDIAREMDDPVLWEALAIIFGGGVDNMDAGMVEVRRLQQRYVQEYTARQKYVGIPKTDTDLHPDLAAYLNPDAAGGS